MKIRRDEVLRYLRMGGAEPDGRFLARLASVEASVEAAVRPRFCWRLLPVASLPFSSADLLHHLAGCSRVFLLAATLGTGVDALLRRLARTSPADLVLAQAVATALIEDLCDDCEKRMLEPMGASAALTRRFSPGYGDLPLDAQHWVLETLDASRRAGISITDALLMVPSKSVSAIIGLKEVS